ncbi:hypothetical protein D9M68_225770 [compost metagenome]
MRRALSRAFHLARSLPTFPPPICWIGLKRVDSRWQCVASVYPVTVRQTATFTHLL